MYSDIDEQVTIERDCEATLIPFGNKITLKKGEEGHITQALGGSYTVMIRGNLVRIEGIDADAIGKIPEVQPWLEETESDGKANEKAVWAAMKTCYDPEIPVNVVDLGLISVRLLIDFWVCCVLLCWFVALLVCCFVGCLFVGCLASQSKARWRICRKQLDILTKYMI